MGDDPTLVHLKNIRWVHALIGNGIPREGGFGPPDPRLYEDIRQYHLREPHHISVSDRGELTIVVSSGHTVIILRPASALASDFLMRPVTVDYYEKS